MAIKMTGLISGLDTDSIVSELISAQKTKMTKVQNKKTKLEWKQEKWQELNKKIYALYTDELSKMRLQGSYKTKGVTSSNENKVTATATNASSAGTHSVKVEQLASAQTVTSAKIDATKTTTKLTELNMTEGTVIKIDGNLSKDNDEVEFVVTADSTIADFVSACKSAGLNASYDTAQQRLFIQSADTGEEQQFTITTATSVGGTLKSLGGYYSLDSDGKKTYDETLERVKEYDTTKFQEVYEVIANGGSYPEDGTEETRKLIEDATYLINTAKSACADGEDPTETLNNLKDFIGLYQSGQTEITSTTSELSKLGLSEITSDMTSDQLAGSTTAMSFVAAKNSIIEMDGAIFESTSNTLTVNNINLKLNAVTEDPITLTVTNNTQETYDMIKSFVGKYNELLKEMNSLYYADSSKGYDPLTDEEKEAMTDEQIEKWETKIKDSLMRRDSSLGMLTSAMRQAMSTTVSVNGKSYSLSTFGIGTSSDYTEKGLLHIYGDEDDSTYSSDTNKLMAALESDPDLVAEVFSKISQKMYDTLNEKMSRTSLSSALTFYNDKEMDSQLKKYEKEISTWETRLQDLEDRYYSKFSAMETALSKLQNQSSYLSSLLGS